MKIRIVTLLLSIGLLQWACQQSIDEKPAIKSVSFVGVPASNVRFDAANSTITVQLPAILTGGLQPRFDLTAGTSVIDGVLADNTIDLTAYCHCRSTQNKEITIRVRNQMGTSTYKLNVLATGSLTPQASNTQLTFSRKTKLLEMSLPVEHLYTNPSITDLLFTNVATGNVVHVNADAACLNTCTSAAPNQLKFVIYSPIERVLEPGTYTIALGSIRFPQRLLVTE